MESRIWLSTLFIVGVLPFALLLVTTSFSIWTLAALLWLFFTVLYVAVAYARLPAIMRLPNTRRLLWHATIRISYDAFALILFFTTGPPTPGMISLVLPLLADSANQWFIAPRRRKLTVMNAAVLAFVILFFLWLQSRL